MKRDFNTIVRDLDGEAFKDEKQAELTMRRVALDSLGGTLPDDDKKTGEEKYKIYQLADRIAKSTKEKVMCEITAEEVTLLKERISKSWATFVMGAVFAFLEADPEATTTTESPAA